MLIRIIPVGNVPGNIINAVRSEFPFILNTKCKILEPLILPKETYNHWRKQFDAEMILGILSKDNEAKFIDKNIPTLFITDQDLFYGNLNYVFGLESSNVGAIVSIARLRPEFHKKRTNNTVLIERAVKECAHMIGHYLAIKHCSHPYCVMNDSQCIEDVDKKKKYFCKDCKVKAAMKGINIE